MNIHNNYSLANCTKNFMIFCAIFLLTRKIICAILEPQKGITDRPKAGKEIENEKVFLYACSGFQG